MATLTVRDVDDDVRDRLRIRAATNGRSMEAEVRAILASAVRPTSGTGLGSRIAARFAGIGGELPIPPREETSRPLPFVDL